jgi:hypothetical protein
MDEILDLAIPGLGATLGREKLRAKRRAVIIGNMFDDSKPPSMWRDDETDDDEDAVDLQDPSHPDYRNAQPTEKPSPRAQWDDARGCWIEWSKAANDWVVVGPVPEAPGGGDTLGEP